MFDTIHTLCVVAPSIFTYCAKPEQEGKIGETEKAWPYCFRRMYDIVREGNIH